MVDILKTSITRLNQLDSDKVQPFINGFSFTVTGGQTGTYDYKIPHDLLVTGAEGVYSGQSAGDYLSIKIVDKDNILGFGNDVILSTSVEKYFVSPTDNVKENLDLGYPNPSQKDLYIRIIYTSINNSENVTIRINLISHKIL